MTPIEYHVKWQTRDTSGNIDSVCEQNIQADDLTELASIFTAQHGPLTADDTGCTLEILSIVAV